MALVNRGPNKPKPEPEVEVEIDISEQCVALKELLRESILSGMATHEVQDALAKANRMIDDIDVVARRLSGKSAKDESQSIE